MASAAVPLPADGDATVDDDDELPPSLRGEYDYLIGSDADGTAVLDWDAMPPVASLFSFRGVSA